MNRQGHDDTTCYFVGPEVEHTPAYSKRTLFVIGKQDVVQIERMAREYRTTHIFLGANHSFNVDPTDGTFYWEKTITALLDKGFWVTLDYQAHEHEMVLKMFNKGIWQSRLFIPLLSVRIPNIQTSSVNLTIKIDDIDFDATNEGVWCLNHHEITDSNRFTPWQDYVSDQVVAPLSGPVPDPVLRVPVPKVVTKIESSLDILSNSIVPTVVEGTLVGEPVTEMNLSELGLDPVVKMSPEAAEILAKSATTPVNAAEAYAAGATEDPLGKEGSKKSAKAKK